MAKPSPTSSVRPRLLVLELWGLGDLALAMPFLRAASIRYSVTLVAKPHATALLARFAPTVELIPLAAPWTSFRGKYRLLRWPWGELARLVRTLRGRHFDYAVSARRDPRDHFLLWLSGSRRRCGFPRDRSHFLLHEHPSVQEHAHRAEHWAGLAHTLGVEIAEGQAAPVARRGRRVVFHLGAGHPVRIWPAERFHEIADRLHAAGWETVLLDDSERDLDRLLTELAQADHFIGNDSGPGHLAALLGVPTFTIFGPQLPGLFAPQHPSAAWIEGRPCPYKPCFDACRFPAPHCILDLTVEEVWHKIIPWLGLTPATAPRT